MSTLSNQLHAFQITQGKSHHFKLSRILTNAFIRHSRLPKNAVNTNTRNDDINPYDRNRTTKTNRRHFNHFSSVADRSPSVPPACLNLSCCNLCALFYMAASRGVPRDIVSPRKSTVDLRNLLPGLRL